MVSHATAALIHALVDRSRCSVLEVKPIYKPSLRGRIQFAHGKIWIADQIDRPRIRLFFFPCQMDGGMEYVGKHSGGFLVTVAEQLLEARVIVGANTPSDGEDTVGDDAEPIAEMAYGLVRGLIR